MKIIFISLLLIITTGCSSLVHRTYYSPDGCPSHKTDECTTEAILDYAVNRKSTGYRINTMDLKLGLTFAEEGNTHLLMGPLFLTIIPMPITHDSKEKNIELTILKQTNDALEIDLENTYLKTEKGKVIRCHEAIPCEITAIYNFINVSFPFQRQTVDKFSLFLALLHNGAYKTLPELPFSKEKGYFWYIGP